ncbi:uncharacterized protein PHACADRAFT_263682 [Phanerochaete carnosa HHB-10118-sp]|uniref:Protein BFR2 n=1 Tax=Phanerochaete carnosa (strain HHB-10118-sp) TaxID=650164 RepID=K5UL92_PHACS|nr:uncharacterized protein PHACADRAFT_263682 [Phanerochaete carnosa HHB-10118-sp]EKM50411.1 hypothetical protein PHACADRAFT_263682 [Phanerochaete carnosa HHB-10118-sp]
MAGRISLAQQLALLSEATPADLDLDDLYPQGSPSEDESHEANSRVRDHYVDVGPSSFRQLNSFISGPKYASTRVFRKDLELSEDEKAENKEEDQDEDSDRLDEKDVHDEEHVRTGARPDRRRPSPGMNTLNKTHDGSAQQEPNATSDLASTLHATREQDRRKGKAVSRQIMIWDTLLDARIRLRNATNAVNHLTSIEPPSTSRQQYPVLTSIRATLDEAISLSQDLFALQENLTKADASPVYTPRKRAKLSHDTERDHAKALLMHSATASEVEAAYHRHLVQVLAKWSVKVQAVAPNVLLPANRGSFKNVFSGKTAPPGVVDAIADTLHTDADKLLARTRSLRLVGKSDAEHAGESTEVFDDADFYQQLLSDIIEARSSGLNNEETEPKWMSRQRANKAKRSKTVDIKASKGRKLRYQVHEKLQNFMVPMAASKGAWHDEQIDELFASLLGCTS